MKNLLTIFLLAAMFSGSYANTQDRMKDSCTSAEEDFISVCIEKEAIYISNEITRCCIPEVIIIDQNDEIFSKGDRDNEIIKNFMIISDFLTEVQGTAYYRMNTMNTVFELAGITKK